MRKVLFLMFLLLLMGLGAAGVKAQVRIGGNTPPNPAATLDLNAAEGTTGTKGLALPRVSLGNVTTPLTGTPVVDGMMVYNTNISTTGGRGIGIYYWVVDSSKWIKVSDGSFLGANVIDSTNIINGSIARSDLSPMGAAAGQSLVFNGSSWVPSRAVGYFKEIFVSTNTIAREGVVVFTSTTHDGWGLCNAIGNAAGILMGVMEGNNIYLWNPWSFDLAPQMWAVYCIHEHAASDPL